MSPRFRQGACPRYRDYLDLIPPDFFQIIFRFGALKDFRHHPFALFWCAASFLRPCALMAATSKGVGFPLSNPF